MRRVSVVHLSCVVVRVPWYATCVTRVASRGVGRGRQHMSVVPRLSHLLSCLSSDPKGQTRAKGLYYDPEHADLAHGRWFSVPCCPDRLRRPQYGNDAARALQWPRPGVLVRRCRVRHANFVAPIVGFAEGSIVRARNVVIVLVWGCGVGGPTLATVVECYAVWQPQELGARAYVVS
jgi:hypothetical protein